MEGAFKNISFIRRSALDLWWNLFFSLFWVFIYFYLMKLKTQSYCYITVFYLVLNDLCELVST